MKNLKQAQNTCIVAEATANIRKGYISKILTFQTFV